MFQKVRSRFRALSLTQQALLLLILMLVFLLGFFFTFLGDNLRTSAAAQTFRLLEISQTPLVHAVESGVSADYIEEFLGDMNTSAIQSALFEYRNDELVLLPGSAISRETMDEIGEQIEIFSAFPQDAREEIQSTGEGQKWYCRLQSIDSGGHRYILLSYTDSTHAVSLEMTILNSVIYLTFLAFFCVLVVFLLWVFSIIRPLNQIRQYIAQVKEGKEVDLVIAREDEIGELANELKKLTHDLARQQKAKEEMIHNISHDLKTPIATIKSYTESIRDGIYPYGDLDSSLDVILDNSNRLEKKVHNLLYMNRVEYLLSSGSDEKTDIRPIVDEILLNSAMIRPEIQIKTYIQTGTFSGMPESWRVLFENILDNAFRYAKSMIIIQVAQEEIAVYNDGEPIDERSLKTLFHPFETGKGGKFGLGLSIVRKIASNNGYRVEAKNVQGGVCFHVYKPEALNRRRKAAHSKSHAKNTIGKSGRKANKNAKKQLRRSDRRKKQKETDQVTEQNLLNLAAAAQEDKDSSSS